MAEQIKDEFRNSVLERLIEPSTFFKSLRNQESHKLTEFYRWVISEYNYQSDSKIVKAAFHEIAYLRDHTFLETLEQLRSIWQNTYLNEFEYILAILQNARDGAKCNCNVYQDSTFNVPPYMDDLEELGRSQRDYGEGWKMDIVFARCKICKTEWEVEIDYTYHYPHSHWRKKSL